MVKVIVLYGDPRPLQMLSLAGGAVGTAVSLAVLWGKRREIISRLRPRRKWIWSN